MGAWACGALWCGWGGSHPLPFLPLHTPVSAGKAKLCRQSLRSQGKLALTLLIPQGPGQGWGSCGQSLLGPGGSGSALALGVGR